MKIFYSPVERAMHAIRVTVSDDGFVVDYAPIHGDSNDYIPSMRQEFLYSDIRNQADFSDHACFNIPQRTESEVMFNFWRRTLAERSSGYELAKKTGVNSVASLIIPFKDSPVSDWVIGFHVPSPEQFEVVNSTASEHPVDSIGGLGSLREIFSPTVVFDMEVATVSPDGDVEIPYKVMNSDGSLSTASSEIFFEATGGYMPTLRKTTVGTGSISVKALGLVSGDKFKVKCGFKYYIGKSQCEITVQ